MLTTLIGSTCSKHGAHIPLDVELLVTSHASKMEFGNFSKKDPRGGKLSKRSKWTENLSHMAIKTQTGICFWKFLFYSFFQLSCWVLQGLLLSYFSLLVRWMNEWLGFSRDEGFLFIWRYYKINRVGCPALSWIFVQWNCFGICNSLSSPLIWVSLDWRHIK